MDTFTTALGGMAAFLTTAANIPQVLKCIRTGESGDLSLKMLIALSMGLALWLADGLMRGDVIIATANAISLCLVGILLGFKFGEHRRKS